MSDTTRDCWCGAPLIPIPGKRGYMCSDLDSEAHRVANLDFRETVLRHESGTEWTSPGAAKRPRGSTSPQE